MKNCLQWIWEIFLIHHSCVTFKMSFPIHFSINLWHFLVWFSSHIGVLNFSFRSWKKKKPWNANHIMQFGFYTVCYFTDTEWVSHFLQLLMTLMGSLGKSHAIPLIYLRCGRPFGHLLASLDQFFSELN